MMKKVRVVWPKQQLKLNSQTSRVKNSLDLTLISQWLNKTIAREIILYINSNCLSFYQLRRGQKQSFMNPSLRGKLGTLMHFELLWVLNKNDWIHHKMISYRSKISLSRRQVTTISSHILCWKTILIWIDTKIVTWRWLLGVQDWDSTTVIALYLIFKT